MALIGSVLVPLTSQAHKEPVHAQIAASAVLSSDGFDRFVNDAVGGSDIELFFQPDEFVVVRPQVPIYWVTNGAYQQDYWPRWGNHFYTVKPERTVGKAHGLSDKSEGVLGQLPKPTTNSYVWATDPSIDTPEIFNVNNLLNFIHPWAWHWPPPPKPKNEDTWGKARSYQYAALTSQLKADRDKKMANTFYSLGHIIHLNQDCSQPDHTRDDAHPFRVHIENYGKKSVLPQPGAFEPQPKRGWAYWRDQAQFKRLRDFWDRGFYRGNARALDLDASGNDAYKLGLAEFSNGNLLGENALYAEFFKPDDTQYFPYPSLANTDQPQIIKLGDWLNSVDSTTLQDGTQGQLVYLKKFGAGKTVKHHSALKYLGAMNMGKMGSMPGATVLTINDPEVLKDYHTVMIPKAIEYSGGILDYFFRGRIDVCPTYSGTPGQYNLAIKNKSGETFKDGVFRLFYDNAQGDRTEIVAPDFAISYSGSLADNEVITGTFTVPAEPVAAYTLVFKGIIGTTDDVASDSVDKDIAVATKRFTWLGGPGESVPPQATAWVAAMTKSVPTVSAVYSGMECTTGFLCEDLTEELITFSYYNLVPSQPNLTLTLGASYSGPSFWLSVSWGGSAINASVEIKSGFNSQLIYSVPPVIGEAQGYAESCEDCVIGPPDPPVGDYPLTLQITPCDPSF